MRVQGRMDRRGMLARDSGRFQGTSTRRYVRLFLHHGGGEGRGRGGFRPAEEGIIRIRVRCRGGSGYCVRGGSHEPRHVHGELADVARLGREWSQPSGWRVEAARRAHPRRGILRHGDGYSDRGWVFRWTHPRAHGHYNATLSGGWYSVFRGLALDLSGSLTGVYGSLNMHGAAQSVPYKFKIAKYYGRDCTGYAWDDCVIGSGDDQGPRVSVTKDGILDAMASNEVTGHVVYKYSPDDGTSQGKVGMLAPDLSGSTEHLIVATLLGTRVSVRVRHARRTTRL